MRPGDVFIGNDAYAGGGTHLPDIVLAEPVFIDGSIWSRTWWRMGGATVTEFSPAAKASMGHWDTQFDSDYADWLASIHPSDRDECVARVEEALVHAGPYHLIHRTV